MHRLSAVVFDLDGTLVRYRDVEFESSWGALAVAAGVREASEALLTEYLPRREAYSEWVAKDAALLAGIPVAQVEDRLFPAPYATGVRSAIELLRGRYRLGILSSGVDLVADWVCEDLGLDFARANHLKVVDGKFTGGSETRVELWAKGEALRQLSAEYGLRPEEVCYVGDHVNDIPAMQIVGMSVAANPKDPRLAEVCDHVIEDFSELPLLIDAFVSDYSGSR